MKTRTAIMLLLSITALAVACAPRARAQDESEPAIAVIGQVGGKVLVQRIGKVVWQPAGQGMELYDGDAVRTTEGASALVSFIDRGTLKLLPFTEITITAAQSPDGAPVDVVLMDQGRAWARMNVKNAGDQFILLTENAVINGRQASAFVESAAGINSSCLEVIQGSASVRPRMYQDRVTTVRSGQRTQIGAEQNVAAPEQTATSFDDTQEEYSCMSAADKARAEEANKQQGGTASSAAGMTGAATADEQQDQVVISVSNANAVTFNPQAAPETPANAQPAGEQPSEGEQAPPQEASDDDVISFAPEATKPPESTQAGQGETPAAAPEEDEYETVEISGSFTINVVSEPEKAAASGQATGTAGVPAVCKDKPVISDVFISGLAAASGESVTLKSSSKCGPVAKPAVVWSASPPKCPGASVTSMTMVNSGIATRLPGGEVAEAAAGKFTFEINDSTARNLVIKALGSNGIEVQYPFSLTVPEPESIPLPRLTDISINGNLVKDKDVLTINYDQCDPAEFYIEGKAKSDCGEIIDVGVTAHEAMVTVVGTDEWNTTVILKESQTVPITITAKDVTGARSKPLNLSIDFTKAISPPAVSIEVVGGYPVSSSMGEPIDVYRNDLVSGKLVITGGAGSDRCTVKKVETSMNGGNWMKADGQNSWTYGFVPRDGDYQVVARSVDSDGTESEEMFQPVELTYYSKTREEILQEAFDQILRAYQDRDSDTINTNTASNYSTRYDSIEDRGRMDNSLNSKFIDLSLIYLRYRVQTVQVSGKSGRITFQWDANPSSAGYSKTGTFVFQKERAGWMLLNIEDDRTFMRYTGIADSVELTPANARLTANNTNATTLTAHVLDSAGIAVKNGTAVSFTASTGTVDSIAITTDGLAVVNYTASDAIGPATITATCGGVSTTATLQLLREFAPPPPGQ